MLVRDLKRLVLLLGPLILLIVVCLKLWRSTGADILSQVGDWTENTFLDAPSGIQLDIPPPPARPAKFDQNEASKPVFELPAPNLKPAAPPQQQQPQHESATHHHVFSASRQDRKFFIINFGPGESNKVLNPNILPHPHHADVWVIVAQQSRPEGYTGQYVQLYCDAVFKNDMLECIMTPITLPYSPSAGGKCTGKLAVLDAAVGPHDARLFYGPDVPYTIYGSNSAFTCFGQFVQDFRTLVPAMQEHAPSPLDFFAEFRAGTELQRPKPYAAIEKNWFLFWDRHNNMYAHYDIVPHRIVAKVAPDGSVGRDLAPTTAAADERCLARYLPSLPPQLESSSPTELEFIHQSTNSLAVTLCRRADRDCKPDASNTFVMTLVQHKTFYQWHSEYDPYAVLFRQEAPFDIYAVSKKPLWIHGRERYPNGLTNMFYVVSMNWKERALKYHGYLDDVLMLAFGIEDTQAGGIDVTAEDLLAGLGFCTDL